MPNTFSIPVSDLVLDLNNFRTVPQENEERAVQAMIAVSPDRFWALMESLTDDGYLPTENILVLKKNTSPATLVVKEGNRRIAALKLIHGYLPRNIATIPGAIAGKIDGLTSEWLDQNDKVPCAIYGEHEAQVVDKIVTLAHGKGEKASRDQWNAVARARHNRDVNKVKEPYLDLLEKYLEKGKNITLLEREQWAGNYPLSVLEEAMKRISKRVGATSAPDLAQRYPLIQFIDSVEEILHGIGEQQIGFDLIRSQNFGIQYGIPAAPPKKTSALPSSSSSPPNINNNASAGTSAQLPANKSLVSSTTQTSQGGGQTSKKVAAVSIQDPRSVKRALKNLKPLGQNRKKVVTLRDEALLLDLNKTPLAFCFILRSMFELSAKAYCDDHVSSGGPNATKSDGTDRHLVDILQDIYTHMTKPLGQKTDQSKVRVLHGALVELKKPEGILSVTSMNQLIHNSSFSIAANDICIVFGNVFPLLEEMNH